MAITYTDIDRVQMSDPQGGGVFIEKVTYAGEDDPTVVFLPSQAIIGISVYTTGSPTIAATNYSRADIENEVAQWADWDGTSAFNPNLTAIRITPGVGAGETNIMVRVYKA